MYDMKRLREKVVGPAADGPCHTEEVSLPQNQKFQSWPVDSNPARVAVMEREFQIDGAVLRDLLALKAKPASQSDGEAVAWHDRVFPLVDKTLRWVEARWPA